jgi:CsoR family transcriptional regulator, copper-sensing transcriptional repressor
MSTTDRTPQGRAAELERRFAGPVAVAALVAVPAVFMAMMTGWPAVVGTVINVATLVIFTVEFVVLLWVADNKTQWLREHKLLVGVFIASVPAVWLFVGGVQVLRLLRVARILRSVRLTRLSRFATASRRLSRAAALSHRGLRAVQVVLAVSALVFAGMALSDPDSQSRMVMEGLLDRHGTVAVASAAVAVVGLCAGAVVAYRSVALRAPADGAE